MTPEQLARLIAISEQAETLRLARILAIEELHGIGMPLRSIGACLGVSHEHVRQVLLSISHDTERAG